MLSHFVNDESGATAIEYGLIATFIAVGIITALNLLGDSLGTMLTDVSDAIGS